MKRSGMTEEQLETLRQQIAMYIAISNRLIERHRELLSQQNCVHGFTPGQAITLNSVMGIAGHQITTRQRWTPSPVQLQILERIFDEDKATPTKKKILEITSELSQYGPIKDTNVYNWFQNRRARTKRKQLGLTNFAESEMDNCVDYLKGKKVKFNDSGHEENLGTRQGNVDCQSHKEVPGPEQFNADFQRHRSMVSFSSQVNSKVLN